MKYLNIKDTLKLVSEFDENKLELLINDHKFHQMIILLCLDGEMELSINMKDFCLQASSLITICPDLNIKLKKLTNNFRCYVVPIQRELLTNAFYVKNITPIESVLYKSPVVQLDESYMSLFVQYFSFLDQFQEKLKGMNPGIIRCHFMSLLMSLKSIYKGQQIEANEEILTRSKIICHDFITLVRKHYTQEHQLRFYAEKMYITPKHLMSVIKKHLGKCPKEFIDKAIIADAKFQLRTTDLCVKQICENLNFPNPSFFGKFFKQHVGVSPNAYRKGLDKESV